jgi:hypothetical protein
VLAASAWAPEALGRDADAAVAHAGATLPSWDAYTVACKALLAGRPAAAVAALARASGSAALLSEHKARWMAALQTLASAEAARLSAEPGHGHAAAHQILARLSTAEQLLWATAHAGCALTLQASVVAFHRDLLEVAYGALLPLRAAPSKASCTPLPAAWCAPLERLLNHVSSARFIYFYFVGSECSPPHIAGCRVPAVV